MHSHWQKQTVDAPLFPDLIWARPENRSQAGRLAVFGGTAQSFAETAKIYNAAEAAGVGVARLILPSKLQRIVSRIIKEATYAPSTPSGSFAAQALAEWLDAANWAEGVIVAPDIGNNSETTGLVEAFLQKYKGPVTLAGDSVDVLIPHADSILDRPQTLLVLSPEQLRKLGTASHFSKAFTSDSALLQLVDNLHNFTKLHQAAIITTHQNSLIVAVDGKISSTNVKDQIDLTDKAAKAAVWWLQNPSKQFGAITSSFIA